jgi:hypothetical protein
LRRKYPLGRDCFLHRPDGRGHSKSPGSGAGLSYRNHILPVDKQTLLDADALPGTDFEDNILIAAAVTASVDAIVTRNVADFAHSHIPVWEPAELLKRLAAAASPPLAGPGPASGPP